MNKWLLRGIVMSIVHIVARILLGMAVIAWPVQSQVYRILAIAVVVLIALVWGGYDGIRDARAHPDPDDYEDLTMAWLKAGLFAGFVSCLVCWFLGTFLLDGIGQSSFWIDITAGTSFVTLLVFVSAFCGVSLGRYLVRRENRRNEPEEDWSVHELKTQSGEVVEVDTVEIKA